jgi:hypothetical protein
MTRTIADPSCPHRQARARAKRAVRALRAAVKRAANRPTSIDTLLTASASGEDAYRSAVEAALAKIVRR